MEVTVLDAPLSWQDVARIADGRAALALSSQARGRLERAHAIVRAIVDSGIRGYGVNTGVGALADVAVARDQQSALSRNILMSHAVGIGAPLGIAQTRAIMVAAINNFCLGYSGLRPVVVERMVALLNAGCTPVVPEKGSVGYLSHMAHIGLLVIGHGSAVLDGETLAASSALSRLNLDPLVLEAKEGLCLVNGTPCATGLGSLALARALHLMAWADAISAMTFETQRCQIAAISPLAMGLRSSPGTKEVVAVLADLLDGSAILADAAGRKTQDALSLRSIPQVHGAVRDAWAGVIGVIDRELVCVTDNPVVTGTPEAPQVLSEAHAVGAGVGLAMDQLGIAMAELGAISERRTDRMVNPLVSGLPAFLAEASGVASGFMIAQYAAVSLVGENRRLASPASLDGGVTSGLQEDLLCHATPGALKALDILDNLKSLLAIELLCACQSYDLLDRRLRPAPRTAALYAALRTHVPAYADDRPLGQDIAIAADLLERTSPAEILQSIDTRM